MHKKSKDDYELLEDSPEMTQLSLFARNKDRKDCTDSSASEDDCNDNFLLEPKSALIRGSYYYEKTKDFSRSAKVSNKNRKSSYAQEDEAKVG